ncbi:MAG: hypothetical protein ABSC94_24180 [Polyangiaceae bacterium]
MGEDLKEEFFVEARQLAVGRNGEQLVGEIHEDAIIACGVVSECDAELTGHERLVSACGEQVVEAGQQLVAGGVVERETSTNSRAEG